MYHKEAKKDTTLFVPCTSLGCALWAEVTKISHCGLFILHPPESLFWPMKRDGRHFTECCMKVSHCASSPPAAQSKSQWSPPTYNDSNLHILSLAQMSWEAWKPQCRLVFSFHLWDLCLHQSKSNKCSQTPWHCQSAYYVNQRYAFRLVQCLLSKHGTAPETLS